MIDQLGTFWQTFLWAGPFVLSTFKLMFPQVYIKIITVLSHYLKEVRIVAEYTTLTSKGQVTVPKEIRDNLKWREGTKLKFYIDGEDLKVKEMTIIDEMEDLIIKDLTELNYSGDELKVKILERKEVLNKALDRLLEERLKEETVPLDEAIRSIENEIQS